jgi:UDP-N-acetylglucosamine--N-acetylmuramyl-(pentapeptide) pyrophosphoryl-undecaprenol N-acetylglucosamine transferase
MRIILSGGGTGGHIYPALSVADALRPHAERLMFLGGESGPERQIVADAGYEFFGLPAAPLRKSPSGAMKAAVSAGGGMVKAIGALRRFKPDLVLATGGYAAIAAGLAAAVSRVPLILVEPNAVPGRVTRALAPAATLIATAIPGTETRLPLGKTVRTGYPIRKEIANGSKETARERWGLTANRPVILVTGGSQGAFTLNQATLEAAPLWIGAGYQLLHSAGRKLYDAIRDRADARADQGYRLVPYIEGMADAFAVADLVVCRGGASTLAELTACGKPGIIVPYPHHADRHQIINAMMLQEAGAAVMIENKEAVSALPSMALRLMSDAGRRSRMSEASLKLGRPGAAEAIAGEIERIVRSRR